MRGPVWFADRERGAMTVIVGVLLLALVAMGLVVLEVGAVVNERRQLRNGADAAALAVAGECAEGTSLPSADCQAALPDQVGMDADALAEGYVGANAEDRTLKEPLTFDPPGYPVQSVRVVGWSRGEDGATFLTSFFNPNGWESTASAVARWGAIAAGNTVPLALHQCEWEEAPKPGGTLPSETVTITLHNADADGCAEGPGGQNAPGNWGWLDIVESCVAETSEDGTYDGTVGNPPPGNPNIDCDPSDFPIGEPILFVIFDEATGTGTNAVYHVAGYAAFELEAYKLHSQPAWRHPAGYTCPGVDSTANCLTGRWVTAVVPGGELADDPTGTQDFGARTFVLIE